MQFNKDNLTPSKIAQDIQEAISNLDEFSGWEDYFAGGAGRTIVELVAGSQAIKNHYNMMRVRESSLVHAKMDSSITELATSKGVYRPPCKGFIVELTFDSLVSGTIGEGVLIGSYKDFDAYSLEHKNIVVGRNTLKVTFGHLIKTVFEVQEDENFHIIDLEFDDMFIADHFQLMTIGNDQIYITDEQMNLYDPKLPSSVLSLVSANSNKLIFGDDVLGKRVNRYDEISYTVLTYDKTVIEKYDHSKLNLNDADMFKIVSYDVIRRATGYLDKEVLRRVALRNSIDGRWVQTLDYENGLMRQFGEYLFDIIVVDSYPTEYITILPKPGFDTDGIRSDILAMIEDKRGNAVDVNVTFIDPDNEQNFVHLTFDMTYFGVDSDEVLLEAIDSYKKIVEGRLANGDTNIVGADIAVELTRLVPNGKFYCDLDQKYVLSDLTYIKELTIKYYRE